MNSADMLVMLYVWVMVLTVLLYHLVRRVLKGRHQILSGPTYPIVRALSIMLIAFSIRHGLIDLILPLLITSFGLDYDPAASQSATEAIVFYVAVTVIAMSYAWMVKQENSKKPTN
ncbi:MAG: hypothetical protein AAF598_17395 [Bacteroidota bacterium]